MSKRFVFINIFLEKKPHSSFLSEFFSRPPTPIITEESYPDPSQVDRIDPSWRLISILVLAVSLPQIGRMPSHSRHGLGFDSFSSSSTGEFAYYPNTLIDRQGTDLSPNVTAVESLSEMTPETRAESGIQFETVVTNLVCFRSSDGQEIDVVSDLAERSPQARELLESEPEDGMGYIQVNFTSAAVRLSNQWHLYTHRHLGTWDDDSNSIPPPGDDWIRRHFLGLDEDLKRELLRTADYFKLRGLYHTVYTNMASRIPWPWEPDNACKTTMHSTYEACFRSSDGHEVYVISDLAEKSPEAKALLANTPRGATGHIRVNFSSAAIRLCIKWFLYSQRLLDAWEHESAIIPPGRDEWVQSNFHGLDQVLMRNVLRAADYFELGGLHRTVSNDMEARNMMPMNILEQR